MAELPLKAAKAKKIETYDRRAAESIDRLAARLFHFRKCRVAIKNGSTLAHHPERLPPKREESKEKVTRHEIRKRKK